MAAMADACVTEDRAEEYVRGALSAVERAAVDEHAERCSDCRRFLSELALHQAAETEDPDRDVPQPPAFVARGDKIDRYVVGDKLGGGGMGVVYAAFDPELQRKVAVKLLRRLTAGEDARLRLAREAQVLASLSHPNVVAVHDIGTCDGRVFVAMELVDGWTLGGWIRETKPKQREIVKAVVAAGRGLAAAHRAGVVHRDVKPDNILVGRSGRVCVGDFGLARPPAVEVGATVDVDVPGTLTHTGTVLGTPRYMAPEQARAGLVDARSDQYSLCASLWEVLGGQLPVTPERVRASAIGDARVRRIVARGLEPDPAARWPSLDALIAALDPERRRRGRVAVVAGAGLVAIAGAATVATYALRRSDESARERADLANETILGRARTVLPTDPAAALHELAAFDPTGAGWERARVLAFGAISRPLPDREFATGLSDAELVAGHGWAMAWTPRRIVLVELESGRRLEADVDGDVAPMLCDAGDRIVGERYAIDLATLAVTRGSNDRMRLAACQARARIYRDGQRVIAWDDRGPRVLGEVEIDTFAPTADGRHAFVGRMMSLTRWSADGSHVEAGSWIGALVAASGDGNVVAHAAGKVSEIWNVATGNHAKLDNDGPITALATSRDGRRVVYASDHRVTQVAADGTLERMLGGTIDARQLLLSDDGAWIVAAGSSLIAWNAAVPEPEVLDPMDRVTDLAIDGSNLVTLDRDGRLRRWPLRARRRDQVGTVAVAYSPDHRVRALANVDVMVRTGDGPAVSVHLPYTQYPIRLAVDDSGAIAVAQPDGVGLWRADGKRGRLGPHSDWVSIPDGVDVGFVHHEVVSWNGSSLVTWHKGKREEIDASAESDETRGDMWSMLSISPDNAWAAASRKVAKRAAIVLFDLAAQRAYPLADSRGVHAAFSPDGKTLATGDLGGGIALWDVATRTARLLRGGRTNATVAAFSPSGARVALAGVGDVLAAATTATSVDVLGTEPAEPLGIAFADEDTVAVAYRDHLRVFDLATRESWSYPMFPVGMERIGATLAVTTRYTTLEFIDTVPRDPGAFLGWLLAHDHARHPAPP